MPEDGFRLAGRLPLDELISLYQRAWLIVSASLAEGWGMVLTEAAACGTPAVATDIVGHRGAVVPEVSGLLVPSAHDLGPAVTALVKDPDRRAALGAGALEHARSLTWEHTAEATLEVLVDATRERQRRPTLTSWCRAGGPPRSRPRSGCRPRPARGTPGSSALRRR